jgi:hypothetical protein
MNELKRCWSLALMVTAIGACSPNVIGGGGGAGAWAPGCWGADGAGGGSTCPPPNPGMCSPSTACVGGQRRTGGASCEDGEWVCATTSCDACDQMVLSCVGGAVVSSCCQPGVWCDAPPSYCDFGDGTCTDGPCPLFDAGAPCSGGTILASDFDQSCASAADCAAVYQGSLCTECFCPNAAVNGKGGLSAYEAAIAGKTGNGLCECPESPPPVCNAGVCVAP